MGAITAQVYLERCPQGSLAIPSVQSRAPEAVQNGNRTGIAAWILGTSQVHGGTTLEAPSLALLTESMELGEGTLKGGRHLVWEEWERAPGKV